MKLGGGNTNLPELLLLNICHYPTITATSGPPPMISQLFHAVFFAWATPFFTVWLFLCRYIIYLLMRCPQEEQKKLSE